MVPGATESMEVSGVKSSRKPQPRSHPAILTRAAMSSETALNRSAGVLLCFCKAPDARRQTRISAGVSWVKRVVFSFASRGFGSGAKQSGS